HPIAIRRDPAHAITTQPPLLGHEGGTNLVFRGKTVIRGTGSLPVLDEWARFLPFPDVSHDSSPSRNATRFFALTISGSSSPSSFSSSSARSFASRRRSCEIRSDNSSSLLSTSLFR